MVINEEVYVDKSLGFENFQCEDHMFKFTKAICDLKQFPRAWYERLRKSLLEKGLKRG